ncbi:TIR domain-containing protein [Oleiharenicola lentus]|uniref:TIR domain-containing protein n=1 Tax=Oleiharenicola lentus TaxID=2508720 RepID=UPI003F672F0A
MPDSAKAVFISYASQDAEVARRICEALRAGGVDVWFDQSELRGGDAWDQSIKRQIRECSLFLPVVSAATQARREGYFRREWKLAVERTHDMDDGVPFLLPISLDGINESDAFVPEAFLRVQWTKLAAKEIPAGFVSRVRNLLEAPAPVRASGGGVLPPSGSIGSSRHGMPAWARGIIGVAGVAVGLIFAVRGVWQGQKKKSPPAPPPTAVAAPATTSKGTDGPKLTASRLALARFENLTGDPKLDNVARMIEGELVRGIAAAPHVRLLPVDAAGRSAAREAARKENAASVILGTYFREGANLAISVEIFVVEEGTSMGTLGPVIVPESVRGDVWTEFVDRLTTGANNVVANLETEPLRLSGLVYTRPWPRWSVAQQLNVLRAEQNRKSEAEMLAAYQALLAKNPELLKAKVETARLLRGMNRPAEAEKEFNELLAMRAQLSQSEIFEITYDLALLQGDPEVALQAARGMLGIRDTRTEITQLLACLWALNRPRVAYEEIEAWWQRLKPRVPVDQQFFPQVGVYASRIAAEISHGDLVAAEKHAAELRAYGAGRQIPTVTWVDARVQALRGNMAGLKKVLAEAGTLPGSARVEPVSIAHYAYGVLLNAGFPKEAEEMQAVLLQRWADLPESVRNRDDYAEVAWQVAIAEKRYDYIYQKLDDFLARKVGSPLDLLGYRALTYLKQGNESKWRELDAELAKMDLRNTRGMTFYWRARLAAANGEKKRATDLLEQAVANGLWFRSFQGGMSDLGRIEPEFAGLRGYAPYEQLLKPKD